MDEALRYRLRMQRLADNVAQDPASFVATCASLGFAAGAMQQRRHQNYNVLYRKFAMFSLKEAPKLRSFVHRFSRGEEQQHVGASSSMMSAALHNSVVEPPTTSQQQQVLPPPPPSVPPSVVIDEHLLWHGLYTLFESMTLLEEKKKNESERRCCSRALSLATTRELEQPHVDTDDDRLLSGGTSMLHSITAVASEISAAEKDSSAKLYRLCRVGSIGQQHGGSREELGLLEEDDDGVSNHAPSLSPSPSTTTTTTSTSLSMMARAVSSLPRGVWQDLHGTQCDRRLLVSMSLENENHNFNTPDNNDTVGKERSPSMMMTRLHGEDLFEVQVNESFSSYF
ncbi:Hypothetical protein, putative [Bodo saltans]|uniref:Uncharacterized protein n=1 Tax=Bodo saltans TaxID=75058 RepID=A0A0S4IY27_BODSA|nr:Hypothetical protein, putative [Bodo saltans]|eukprot:CUG14746.1 Hypothetical protein, putative [Bodo saltans]